MANISVMQQNVAKRKTALKTSNIWAVTFQIWWTLVHK